MKRRYFKLMNTVDYIDLKQNTIIIQREEDNKYYWGKTDRIIGDNIIDIIRPKLQEITMMFGIGDTVLYNYKGGEQEFTISDINICYSKPVYDLHGVHINVSCSRVYEQDIKKANVYWFINSEGDVAQAILNKNKHADMWRMRIHNYYSNKSDAQGALINIRLKADAENAISIDLANANKK